MPTRLPLAGNHPIAIIRCLAQFGLAAALVVAGIDMASDTPLLAARFHHFNFYLEAALISVGFFFAVYLIVGAFFSAVNLALGVHRFVAITTAAAVIYWLRGYMQDGEWTSPAAFIQLAVCIVAGIVSGWLLSRLDHKSEEWSRFLGRVPTVVSASAIAFLVFFWLTEFGGRGLAKAEPAGVSIGWAAVVALVLFGAVRGLSLSGAQKFVLALAALFLISLSSRLFSVEFVALDSQIVGAAEPKIKNVILIVVDTLRADALRAYNPEAAPAGGFDQFASESYVFENAVASASWTYPSMISVMTGLRPYQVDASSLWKLIDGESFSDIESMTLADFMTEAGYYSRGILGNHLLYRPGLVTSGLAEVETYTLPATGWSVGAKLARKISTDRYLSGSSTENLTDQAIDFLQSNAGQSNFLWLHYFDPHDEYAPPKEYVEDKTIDRVWTYGEEAQGDSEKDRARAKMLYDAEVRSVGDSLDRLFAELRALGIYDNSMIVLTSDHGEEFWDHGGMYHGGSLYQELLHVPLMIRLPGQSESARISSFVANRAILPTVLDACGINTESPDGDWAPSLLPLMESVSSGQGEQGVYDQPVISSGALRGPHVSAVAVYLDHLKYISHASPEDDQLFDLSADPSEQNNIIADAPERLEEARAAAAAHKLWVAEFRERRGLDESDGNDGPKTFEDRLKSLGYIQ